MIIAPAEYLELMQLAEDAANVSAMNCLAIVFAYVTAIYLVGAKLSRFELSALTILYTVFLMFPIQTLMVNISRVYRYGSGLYQNYPDIASDVFGASRPSAEFFFYAGGFVFFLCWLLSVIYMIKSAKAKRL